MRLVPERATLLLMRSAVGTPSPSRRASAMAPVTADSQHCSRGQRPRSLPNIPPARSQALSAGPWSASSKLKPGLKVGIGLFCCKQQQAFGTVPAGRARLGASQELEAQGRGQSLAVPGMAQNTLPHHLRLCNLTQTSPCPHQPFPCWSNNQESPSSAQPHASQELVHDVAARLRAANASFRCRDGLCCAC